MTEIRSQKIKTGNYELFSTDYIVHAGSKEYKGHEFIKRFINQLRSAIPDIRVVKVEFLAESSDTITWQRTLSGTHKANMMGIKPSNQKMIWCGRYRS